MEKGDQTLVVVLKAYLALRLCFQIFYYTRSSFHESQEYTTLPDWKQKKSNLVSYSSKNIKMDGGSSRDYRARSERLASGRCESVYSPL